MEVEDKEAISLLECDNFVSLMSERCILVFCTQPSVLFLQSILGLVPIEQELKPVLPIIGEMPLASTMVIRPAITFSWEIDPLWMSKLVTHKVKVTFTTKTRGEKSHHFVESHASVNCDVGWCIFAH